MSESFNFYLIDDLFRPATSLMDNYPFIPVSAFSEYLDNNGPTVDNTVLVTLHHLSGC